MGPAPVVEIDYAIQAEGFESGDMACKPSSKGLKCRASAGNSGGVWAAFGPEVPEAVDGLLTIDFDFTAHTGLTSGIAWGIWDGRWTGVLLSNNPESMGAAWFGAWDGSAWVPYRDWGDPVVPQGWGPHHIHVEFRPDGYVQVSIDGIEYSTMRPTVPMGGAIAPVMMGVTRTDFQRLALGGGEVRREAPTAVPPAPVAAAASALPLATVALPGKWEWWHLGGEPPEALFEGWNDVAADGDTLLVQNNNYSADGALTATLYASARCGREPWQVVTATASTSAALEAYAADRAQSLERAKEPRYQGRNIAFHRDGPNLYAVEGETLLASFDNGVTWRGAQTIGLSPVPRFAQLVSCGTGLVLVPEVPAVWESMKPLP